MQSKVESSTKKITKKIKETKKKINSIKFDAHHYRRAIHAFGASFLCYYILPDDINWIKILKILIPILIVVSLCILEYMRIKGTIEGNHFFGLRMYEKNRVGSYVFFGIGILILLLFFPQQIAVPCILCASLADPLMGEIRYKHGERKVILAGFIVCAFLFAVTWYNAQPLIIVIVTLVGATGAVIGETRKFRWLDDDFMIQILPAILIALIWIIAGQLGINMPEPLLHAGEMGWLT
ncbi:dolichol kinase [Thermoplasmatales archaeon SCGC AB-539-N05]|nr:dolichol kinase [Thermoplasmatales archaeon SCGC AB-539-N05]